MSPPPGRGKGGLRFVRTTRGDIRIYTADTIDRPLTWAFHEEDAIMLRDWLNDEWPV